MDKLPIGVIGVGHLGSLHAKMLAHIPSAALVGVYDLNSERAEMVAREYGTKAFATISDLLERVQAVCIVTPTSEHFAMARLAIECGRHVFIEKPMTSSVAEAEDLVERARHSSVKVQVGHIERFNPAILALEHYHLNPMFVESHRLAQFNPRGTDVAVVLDLMIHDIDIIMSLVRSPVVDIQANGLPVVSDTIDIANARLQFENGCVANVTASRISQKKMRKMRLFQRDAYISIDFSDGVAEVFRLADGNDSLAGKTMMLGEIGTGTSSRKIVYEQPEIKEVNALGYELELFVGSVLYNRDPAVTAEEGFRALKIAHDIMEKIHQQKLSL